LTSGAGRGDHEGRRSIRERKEVTVLPRRAASDEGRSSAVRIRAIRSTDAPELQRFYAGLSPDSRRTRFLAASAGLSEGQSISFCTTDHDHREGFVAVVHDDLDRTGRIVGHLCLEPDGADAAEVAIAVADEFQHQGIGRGLMVAGIAWARREHVVRFTATMSADNAAIHRLLVGLGLPTQSRFIGSAVSEITIDVVAQSIAA
jgi:GNAT superfamily N-acetyltransferase